MLMAEMEDQLRLQVLVERLLLLAVEVERRRGGTAGLASTGGNFNGGAGGLATSQGAGGGGGAGNNGNGTAGGNSSTGVGGAGSPNVAPYIGGAGGATRSSNGTGNTGGTPGGGGGGGRQSGFNGAKAGGQGGAGQVVITYTVCTPPAAPTVTSPVNYCLNETAIPLTATGSNLLWYTLPSGGTGSSSAPTPSTATAGTTSYYVSQTIGCEVPRATIDVIVAGNSIAPSTIQNINVGLDGTPLTVTETAAAISREWFYGTDTGGPYTNTTGITTSSYTPNFAVQGTYFVVCKSTFACGTVTSNQVQVNVSATITTGAITGSPFCVTASAGESVSVPFTSTGTF